VGRASVPITIPAGTPAGTLVLTVSVASTGTSIDVPIVVTSTAPPITVVTAPKVTGSAKVGSTLKTTGGKWSVAKPTLAYQWNRNGTPIDGATGASYRLVAADAGTHVSVTVTASAAGHSGASATSASVTVQKSDTKTRGSLGRTLIKNGATATYSVVVSVGADGRIAPTGPVTIYDGRHVIATVTLTPDADGRASVPLTGLGRGIHRITASYAGTDQLASSTSNGSVLIVW
jgi:5'-nucleotidase